MKKKMVKLGSDQAVERMSEFLLAESSILRGVIESKKLTGRAKELLAMTGSLLGNTNATSILVRERQRFLNEIYVLGGAFLERTVALLYLLHSPKEDFENYREHTRLRMYKSLNRKFTAGEISIITSYPHLSKEETKDYEQLKAKFKKQRNRWGRLKLEEMLTFLKNEANLNISTLLVFQTLIYADAAEARHGSFYGSTFHTGAYDPNLDKKDLEAVREHVNSHSSLALMLYGMLIDELIQVLCNKLNLRDFSNASQKNAESAKSILKEILKKN